jgi:hypothetical protein
MEKKKGERGKHKIKLNITHNKKKTTINVCVYVCVAVSA